MTRNLSMTETIELLKDNPSSARAEKAGWIAFTLVELLVVVSIISILAAMLFPSFIRARETAKRTQCLSNLHQIACALRLYCDDNEQSFPWYGPAGDLDRSAYWDNALLEYVRRSYGVFHCPKVPTTDQENWLWQDPGGTPVLYPNQSYGYNAYGAMGYVPFTGPSHGLSSSSMLPPRPVRENSLFNPSMMVALADYDPTTDDDGDHDLWPDLVWGLCLKARHLERVSLSFCDGHVDFEARGTLRGIRFMEWNTDHALY